MTDAQRIAALEQQVTYWRGMAASLNQILQATRTVPELHRGRTITYADRTGNRAAAQADRSKGLRP